jgi:type II secretory pathway pseudopilin PulG
VIVAVLAAIAVPVYARYVKYARTSEATDRMGEIVTAAKAYAVANPGATGVPMWPPSGGKGLVSLSGTPHFTYAITSGGGLSAASAPLTVRATGRAGTYMNKVTVTVTVPNYQAGAKPPVVAGF